MADSTSFAQYMPSSPYVGAAGYSQPDIMRIPTTNSPYVIDNRGEFVKGVSRGVDSLQQMGYGAAGLASDVVGADRAKEYFYNQAQEQAKQIASAPAAVSQFTDITNAGELGQWFMGAVGEALPSSAASLIGSGVGAAIFKAATLKLAGNAALKGALAGQVEKLVATGVVKQEAEKLVVKEFFKSEIAQTAAAQGASRGAYAGAMTIGSGMESGSNWLDDIEKNGMQNTNPLKDLLFGVAGGAVESGLGAERRLIGKLAAQKAEKELTQLASRGILKNVGAELGKSMAGEGTEEFTQQLLSQASTMRNASLDDMLYAKQDFKAAFNAGMAGAAGGVLFGATGGIKDHVSSRGYQGGQTQQSAAEAILERNRATTEVATQKIQAASRQYDAGLAQLDAGRQKLMDNMRQISITVQDPAQQQQLMSQVQQQLIDANAQRINLQKEKDTYLEEAKKELTKFNKKTELEVTEAQAEELVKAPKSLLDIKTRVLEEERKATGLAAVDTHAQREIDKVDNRITEHQKAIEAINNSMTETRRNGGVIGNENVDLLKWHEQQIADERRYAAGVLKEYNKAKDTKSLEESRLFDLYRDKDHAANLTAFKYQDATRNVADSALSSVIKAQRDRTSQSEMPLAERLNNLRLQNVEKSSAANSIDGMTRAISASTRMYEINSVLKPAAQRRDVIRMADQVASSMRMQNPGVAYSGSIPLESNNMQAEMNRMSASRTPVELAARPLGARVQPNGYQTLLNNRRMAESQKQQELATAQRQGAIIALKAVQEKEKADKTAYQKLSMDQNRARNEGRKRLVSGWIAGTVAQLKSLKDVVKVLDSNEVHLLPDYVQEAYSGKGAALIDLNTGTIYLFADKMHNKQHAVRTLLHESVAHFGLRSIMTPDQLDKFLHMIAREFIGTEDWDKVAKYYPDYDTFSIAEEYVARYAEQIRLSSETMTKARIAFNKVKEFFRNLLQQLGLVKVSEQDIKDVLLASVYNLTQGKNLKKQLLEHSETNNRAVMSSSDWRNVKESRDYKEDFESTKNWFTSLMKPTNAIINKNGKIVLSDLPTFREKTLVALHDTFYPVLNLQKMVELNGGEIPLAANVYEREKTSHNEVSNDVLAFSTDVMGVDPTNFAARPAEGTFFDKASKIHGLPTNPRELLKVIGEIAQAWHAPEANKTLALKSIDKVQLAKAENRIKRLKDERAQNQGKLSVEKSIELDKSIVAAEQYKDKILDVREDLYGMSNAEAKAIRDRWETPQNAGQIAELMTDLQKINAMIMDKAVAEGLLDPRLRRIFDETYAFYVPNTKWESTMRQVVPSYGTGSSALNMNLWEYTKERTGTDTLGSNPIVSLMLKMENVIKAASEKRKGTALHLMYRANPEMLSEVMEPDNHREILDFSKKLKDLSVKLDKLLVDSKTGNTREIIKGLQKRITELQMEHAKQQVRINRYTTDVAKMKADRSLMKIEEDIQNAKDGIAALRAQQEELRRNPEYITLEQQRKDLIAARKALYNERGFSQYITTNSAGDEVIKWKKNPSKFTGKMDQVITLFDEDGNKVRYLIKNAHLLAALKGTHVFKSEVVIKFLGKMQRYMAQLYTTFSPAFIVVNAIRDFVTANIHIRHLSEDIPGMGMTKSELSKAYIQHWAPALKQMYAMARDGKVTDQYWAQKIEDFKTQGGYTSMYNLGNWTNAQKSLEHSMRRALSDPKAKKEAMYAAMNWMQDASNAVENSSRLAAFAVISDNLVKNGTNVAEANRIAAAAALDLTVNFTKRGTWGPIISSLFLFSQASINSSVRIARAMFPASDKAKPFHQKRISKYLTGLMLFGIITGMLARAVGGDDDDGVSYYDKIPASSRYGSVHFAVAPNTFLKIPVAFGYQSFFTLGAVLGDMMMGRIKPGEALNEAFKSALNNFSFIGGGNEDLVMAVMPTVMKPLAQVAANKNFFGGAVYPENKSWEKGDKPDSQKAWKNTSAGFRWIAEMMNAASGGNKDRPGAVDVSPAVMEHVLKQYFGGIGDLFIKTANLGEKVISGKSPDIDMNNIPVISRFATQSTYENTLHEYTKIKKEIEVQLAEYKRAKESKVGITEMIEVMDSTVKGRLLEKRLEAVQKTMAESNKMMNKLASNPSISEERKYAVSQTAEKKSEAIIKAFIKTARMAGVK